MRLNDDLKRIERSGEAVLLIGDLNRAVGLDEFGVYHKLTDIHAKVARIVNTKNRNQAKPPPRGCLVG